MEKGKIVWCNGELKHRSKCLVDILSHTLHYGTGAFEGIIFSNTSEGVYIFRLKEHVDRLFDSAKMELLEMPFGKDRVDDACIGVVQANKKQIPEGYIRPLVYVDEQEEMGMGEIEPKAVRLAIMVWSWGTSYLGENALRGIKLKTASCKKPSDMEFDSKAIGNYRVFRKEKVKAIRVGKASKLGFGEALFLDERNCVAECSAENIFFVANYGGKTTLVTPHLGSSILSGITRDTVIKIAKDMGYGFVQKYFLIDELFEDAYEVFATGTSAGVVPIIGIDNEIIGNGERGEITKKIQKIYNDIIHGRGGSRHNDWLTLVK